MNTRNSIARRSFVVGAAGLALGAVSQRPASAADFRSVHFLIPGGAGGGWDGTARGVGQVLTQEKLVRKVSYENMSGAGGGKAIGYLIETADRQKDTLMVNSTPIVVRSLTRVFPYSFRDLTPIASVIADFQVLAVRADSEMITVKDLMARFRLDPRRAKVAGGSVRGDLDHLVPAMVIRAAREDPKRLIYIAYDAGGKALAGLLSGETEVLSTGLGEAIGPHRDGLIRIIAVSSPDRVVGLDVPTLRESGLDVTFANWRGFFAAPGISEKRADRFAKMLGKMMQTPSWEQLRNTNGWSNIYQPRAEFVAFLTSQEEKIGNLMRELCFLQ